MGMTQEHFDAWYNDPLDIATKINSKSTYTRLDDDEGHMMVHCLNQTPMMITNRTFIATWYN